MTEKIRKYFTLFDRLDLKSRVYVLAERENHIFLFEVYKSHFNSNLTVTQLCKMDRVSNTIEYLNPDIIWGRRKKLNGVTLKVGHMEDNILMYDGNKVITLYFTSSFWRYENNEFAISPNVILPMVKIIIGGLN